MTKETPQKRVAIYTRKSVEEGLDMEFNSLDAQRESGEAYIKSQKANGWYCIPKHYDDGGYSGGNTNRPALRQLMADCRDGQVDIVLVYKIDRLSRSLCDFLELTRSFEQLNVSFCSVTQDINTSTSSGRMMLNILATFSQYEREVISERIRDKFAASKRKGMWVGGVVPLGYRIQNHKLVILPEEAEVVRNIFKLYLETQSPAQVAAKLNEKGVTTKAGKTWNKSNMYHILHNCIYTGLISYNGKTYQGEHEAIIDKDTWELAQRYINKGCKEKGRPAKNTDTSSPLRGMVVCGHCGGPMTLTMTKKKERYYGYYRCSRDSKRPQSTCPIRQIASKELERTVFRQLSSMFRTPAMLSQLERLTGISAPGIGDIFTTSFWDEATTAEKRRLAELLIAGVKLYSDKVELELKTDGIHAFKEQIDHENN